MPALYIASAPTGLEIDDGRRKCLADKAWCRRSVVVQAVGAAGASSLDEVPGREDYDSNEEGALEWAEAALAFTEENFNDGGGEVRSHDQRDCKVGLFGDFLERMGHGKFFEWVQDMERGGLYTLQKSGV